MIRKLAEELATNDLVPGTNDIRPAVEPAAPAAKATADHGTLEQGWPKATNEGNNQTQAGVLSRALKGYSNGVRGHNDVLATALGAHVRKITGSSSLSRSAVRRNKQSRGGLTPQ